MANVPNLPIELWAESLSFLSTEASPIGPRKGDLKDVSLTCSSFRHLAQPLLFRELCFEVRHHKFADRIAGIRSLLDDCLGADTWTKELMVFGEEGRGPRFSAQSRAGQQSFSALFISMHGLRRVHFDHLACTESMVDHIWRSRLHTLILRHAPVRNSAVTDPAHRAEIMFVTELHLGGYRNGVWDPPNHFDATWMPLILLPSLTSSRLSEGATRVAYRILHQNPSHVFTNLRTLSIESPLPEQYDSFVALMSSCPNLARLRLDGVPRRVFGDHDDEVVTPYTLPAKSLSSLSSYSGPLTHSKIIIPGRPVTKIVLYVNSDDDTEVSADNLLPLSKSSTPVTTLYLLRIIWKAEYAPGLVTYFHALTELHIRHNAAMRMGDALVHSSAITSILPRLRYLLFLDNQKDGRTFRHQQKATLEKITASGSLLKTARFQDHETWMRCSDGVWRCGWNSGKFSPELEADYESVDSSYEADDSDELESWTGGDVLGGGD